MLFQTSHVVEHLLTDRAQGNLAALYDTIPKTAVLVDPPAGGNGNGSGSAGPDMGSARRVRAAEVAVGDCMLVKPGEQVGHRPVLCCFVRLACCILAAHAVLFTSSGCAACLPVCRAMFQSALPALPVYLPGLPARRCRWMGRWCTGAQWLAASTSLGRACRCYAGWEMR